MTTNQLRQLGQAVQMNEPEQIPEWAAEIARGYGLHVSDEQGIASDLAAAARKGWNEAIAAGATKPRKSPKKRRPNRALAGRIAESLFTAGSGVKAEHLVLMRKEVVSSLGGWAEKCCADHIETILDRELSGADPAGGAA